MLYNNKGQRGVFTLTSPNPVSNLKLTRAIGESFVYPSKLLKGTYHFKYQFINKALDDMLKA